MNPVNTFGPIGSQEAVDAFYRHQHSLDMQYGLAGLLAILVVIGILRHLWGIRRALGAKALSRAAKTAVKAEGVLGRLKARWHEAKTEARNRQ